MRWRGEVILQSHLPDHYAIVAACAQDYPAFFEREMQFRRTMGYPPVAALVNLIVRAREPAKGAREAEALAGRCGKARSAGTASSARRTAPLARLRQEHRFQVVLKGSRPAMREAVRRALVSRYGETRWPGWPWT